MVAERSGRRIYQRRAINEFRYRSEALLGTPSLLGTGRRLLMEGIKIFVLGH